MKKVLKWIAVLLGLFLTGLIGMVLTGLRQAQKTAEEYDS